MTVKKALITVQEASELTNLSITTLRRGIKTGRFLAVRAGGANSKQGKFLFDRQVLLKILRDEALGYVKNEERKRYLSMLSQDEEDNYRL